MPLCKPKAVVKLFKSPEGHPNGLETTNEGLWIAEEISVGGSFLWMSANGRGVGSLEQGKSADFVVLRANPLIDVRNTRSNRWVWDRGPLGSMGVMTEIAAVGGLVLIMTFHAVNHSSGPFLHYYAPISHRTMTNSAFDVGLPMMHLVREIHESRKFVDPHPWNRLPLTSESLQGLDSGAILLDRVMAAHAECRTRKSGQISGSGDGVATQAGQAGGRMQFVVERDRLRGRSLRRQVRRRGSLSAKRPSHHPGREQFPSHEGRAKATKSPGL